MQPQDRNSNPDQALADSVAAVNRNDKVANRIPELKMSAYILLGLTLFSALQVLVMRQVIVGMLGTASAHGLLTFVSAADWALSITACIIVLTTRNTKLVKIILLLFGCTVAYDLLIGLTHVDIVGTGINAFIAWWTYNLYQSVEALEIRIH